METEEIQRIKRLSIVDYLSKRGYKWVRRTEKNASFLSPFRNESHPSFVVNNYKNIWTDFGENTYGDIISLVMKLDNVSFNDACNSLLDKKFLPIKSVYVSKESKKSIIITKTANIFHDDLIKYLSEDRKIDMDIANLYCKESEYSFPNGRFPDHTYRAISFANDFGGRELRNEHIKLSTDPKGYTTIKGLMESDDCIVFEGFISFLSALTYFKTTAFKNKVYVLNGVGMLNIVLPLIKGTVYVMSDNDKAGDKVLADIKAFGLKAIDSRHYYDGYNDFNDLLTGKLM